MEDNYRFQVRGHLEDRWSEWLGGLSIERLDDGTSVLTGAVSDQAALHGVIARIRDLGLPLLAVERASEGSEDVSGDSRTEARGSPMPPGDAPEQLLSTGGISDRSTDIGGTSCD
jgi:hypothetical protein